MALRKNPSGLIVASFNKDHKMIEVYINDKILAEAKQRNAKYYQKFGNTGTHRLNKERQRMTGYLAEACIVSKFPCIKYSEDYNVDFVLDSITIDSKSQGCNVKPLGYFSATLYEEQKNRNTDYYIFSRVKNDFSIVWICGIISKKDFFKIAQLKNAGTVTNNFIYDQSRYEVEYKSLKNIHDFIEKYGKQTNA